MTGIRNVHRFLPLLFFFEAAALLFFSCSMSASRKSFTGKLDEIDALIEQGQDADALSELKKIEKHTYDSWSRIGIFRRYYELGETERAEQILKKGLRRNPRNHELSAVYSNFLLRSGRTDEAMKVSACLRGTKYGSLYSEAYLAHALSSEESGEISFSDKSFYPVYYDAYQGSHDSYWLRNCAVICMAEGSYDKAVTLQPQECTEPENAYFWGLVMFDSRLFGSAAAYAQKALALYPDSSIHSRHMISPIEMTALLSDSFISMSETEQAEKVRRSLISGIETSGAVFNKNDEAVRNILPALYVDSALYAEAAGNDDEGKRLLSYTVQTWPDCVPGLISYADFAFRTSKPLEENEQEQVLRDKGVATLRMEKYDSRVHIPVSDAEYRMERSLERKNDPLLYIAHLDLKYRTDSSLTVEDKIADVWNELENSMTGTDQYPELLFEFAVNKLLSYGQVEDAWTLFSRYVISKRKFDPSGNFWEQTVAHIREFPLAEAEYAAWFAAYQRYADTAVRLYEYCVYESGGVQENGDAPKKISAFVSTPSCMNLAMIYSSLGANPQALELYSGAALRCTDTEQKSEIMCRMAAIYVSLQKPEEALRSAGYALGLDPQNARAKLLRDQLAAQ